MQSDQDSIFPLSETIPLIPVPQCFITITAYVSRQPASVAQSVERVLGKDKVASSILA